MSIVTEAEKTGTSFSQIPIIDLQNARSENEAERRALATEVRKACMTAGFFYVKNHGIPQPTIDAVHHAAESFFALDEDVKMKVRNSGQTTSNFKGYTPLRSAKNDPNGDGDVHEGFLVGFEEPLPPCPSHLSSTLPPSVTTTSDQSNASAQFIGSNTWPSTSDIDGAKVLDGDRFREDVMRYYHAAVGLGKVLFPLFAMALELEERWFEGKTKNSAALMRLLHYPPQYGEVDDRVIGIGAHTDWECFTILWQQPHIQALQVLSPEDQKWIDAPPMEGTLVINLGDQFARWTNGIFQSNTHRAINRSGVERYSIPLFFGTDYDVALEPIPSCVSPERPPKYEVVTAGEFIQARLKQTYS